MSVTIRWEVEVVEIYALTLTEEQAQERFGTSSAAKIHDTIFTDDLTEFEDEEHGREVIKGRHIIEVMPGAEV
jgi:predicted transcriptional regulator